MLSVVFLECFCLRMFTMFFLHMFERPVPKKELPFDNPIAVYAVTRLASGINMAIRFLTNRPMRFSA